MCFFLHLNIKAVFIEVQKQPRAQFTCQANTVSDSSLTATACSHISVPQCHCKFHGGDCHELSRPGLIIVALSLVCLESARMYMAFMSTTT